MATKDPRLAERVLARANAPVPGCAVVVVREGRTQVSCAGLSCIERQDAVAPHTVFHLASVSKIVTALAVLQLVDEGVLTLETLVEDAVPGLHFEDRCGGAITIRHVLTHTSGLPDNYVWHWPKVREDDRGWEVLVDAAAKTPLLSAPGQIHTYSSIAYDLLAPVVSELSSSSFEEAIRIRVLDRLGMLDSSFLKDAVAARLASPHVPHDFKGLRPNKTPTLAAKHGDRAIVARDFPFNRARAAGGNLLATPEDVGRFLISALGGFPEIISRASWTAMSKHWADSGRQTEPWYGLGLRIGEASFGHGGLDVGFRCGMRWFPSTGEAVAVLTNYFHGSTEDMMAEALER